MEEKLKDPIHASNLFADDLFQDPPVFNGFGNHLGGSGDSSPLSDYQPWPSQSYMNVEHQSTNSTWSTFGLNSYTGVPNVPEGGEPAYKSYDDYLTAYGKSEFNSMADFNNAAQAGHELYSEAMKQWATGVQKGTYEPFGVVRDAQKPSAKPSYSDVAKNKPPVGAPKVQKVNKNEPNQPLSSTTVQTKKSRASKSSRSRPVNHLASAVKPNSKYGLDDFEVPKVKRSISTEALSSSRRGSSSSIASSTTSNVEDVPRPYSVYSSQGSGSEIGGNAKNNPKTAAGASNIKDNRAKPVDKPKDNNEKLFFDPRRIFQSSDNKPKTSPRQPEDTILNNDKARSQPSMSASSVHKTTYINNNLHEGMESRKRTNTEAKQGNAVPSKDKNSIKDHFLVVGLTMGYEWIVWAIKQGLLWLAVLFVLILKFIWVVILAAVFYGLMAITQTWSLIKSKMPRVKIKKGAEDEKFAWSNCPRQFSQTGFEENLPLPTTGEEAMKRLLCYKGKDPYSILGLRHDASDEDIKRYYRRQAVLVHPDKNSEPGAEEAFKILGHAFDLIGDPVKRKTYDTQKFQDEKAEATMKEFADLLQKFQQKMEEAANQMRCDTCGGKHRRVLTKIPWYSARKCNRCQTRHSAKEGDIWAETTMMGFKWHYYALIDGDVFDITELAACQTENFKHVAANSHTVALRIQTNSSRRPAHSGRSSEAELEDFLNSLFHGTSERPQPSQHDNRSNTNQSTKKKRKGKKRH